MCLIFQGNKMSALNNTKIIKTDKIKTDKILGRNIKRLGELPNRNRRLWINNLNLKKSFDIGDAVNVFYDREKKIMIVEKTEILSTHTISSRNKGETPILDIKNKSITELFDGVEKVEIMFFENKIIVKIANVEKAKNERASKNNYRFFELFCGGGTLSQFFKEAGFKPAGGLEIDEKFLTMYEDNHGDDLYTILASLEDVSPGSYPKDVDTALIGIPCTSFSGSNVKLQKVLSKVRKGEELNCEDKEDLKKRYEAEALTFFALEAIRAMNVKTILIEEVVEFSITPAAMMLRTVLGQMGYEISETVSSGTMSKRKRWCLVANMGAKVNLENLLPESTRCVNDILEIPVELRDWKKASESKRASTAISKATVGVRVAYPEDTKVNTFTTHGTRSTEPFLAIEKDGETLYSEFTNKEIAAIHGLENYKLSDKKISLALIA